MVAGLLAVVALTGCDTTQNKAARLKIRSERTLASREPTKLGEPAKDVEVVDATVLRGDGESAIAVTLRNTGSEPVNDLPLLVGVHKPGGGREYLNDGKDVAYFKAHAPALAAGEDGVWIYTGKQRARPRRSGVREGRRRADAAARARLRPIRSCSSPRARSPPRASDRVQVDVANEIGFTQYDLDRLRLGDQGRALRRRRPRLGGRPRSERDRARDREADRRPAGRRGARRRAADDLPMTKEHDEPANDIRPRAASRRGGRPDGRSGSGGRRVRALPGVRRADGAPAALLRQCATRRPDVSNPASRYFAAASRQRRVAATRTAPAGNGGNPGTATRAAGVFFFALLPIAVAIGVLVGRGGASPDEEKLLAALRDSNANAAVTADTASKSETVSASDELLPSDFSLDKGYTVKIGSLPIETTDQAAADDAKTESESKGAKDVGIINPGDYATTPDQGQKDYILYSGEFKSRGDAEKALAGLKKNFPDAAVIEVESSAAAGAAKGGDLNQNEVVAQTSHGTVHQVTTEPPSDEQVAHDTAIVNDIANQTGDDYTDAQQQLPDVTVVGGDPDDAPPLPTGVGD